MKHLQVYTTLKNDTLKGNTVVDDNDIGDNNISYDSSESDYDSNSADLYNRSPVGTIGVPVSVPVSVPTVSPKPVRKQLFEDNDTVPNDGNFYLAIPAMLIFALLILNSFSVTRPLLIGPGSKTISPINWWDQYNSQCCLIDPNITNIYGTRDCSANGRCRDYLENWLENNNQTFYNSSWSQRCCYDYRSIGSVLYHTYCSFTCLNTERNKTIQTYRPC